MDEETKINEIDIASGVHHDIDFNGVDNREDWKDLSELAVPSDIIAHKVRAENNPLVMQQRSGKISDKHQDKETNLLKGNQGTKRSMCAVPIIEEHQLH